MFRQLTTAKIAVITSALVLLIVSAVVVTTSGTDPDVETKTELIGSGSGNAGGNGNGNANGNANSDAAKDFTISGSTTSLYPGAHRPLVLTLTNPNNNAISVTAISVLPGAPGTAGCAASNITVAAFVGPLTIAKNSSAQTTLYVDMKQTAPNACQGASFPLIFGGKASKI